MGSVQKKSLELMRKHLSSISDAEFLANHRKAKNFGGITVDEFLSSSRYAGMPTSPSHLLGNVVYKRPAQHHHAFNVSGALHDRDVNAARNILAAGHCRLAGGIPAL